MTNSWFTAATRSEPGCLWFDWSRSLDDPTEYVLVEAFRDGAAGGGLLEQLRERQAGRAASEDEDLELERFTVAVQNAVAVRVEQPQRKDFVSVVLSRRDIQPVQTAASGTENLLAQARTFYKNGNDEEAACHGRP